MSAPASGKVTGFLTDATLCIGCKACEVACKEWNQLSDDGFDWSGFSYDNTGSLGHSTWRHVKFVESDPQIGQGGFAANGDPSWSFSSDVCKHCEEAGCLEACPTGAIVRGEFGNVFIQPDVCNGCAYCVVSCPFGVVERNPKDGRAFKCTFCHDRQRVGLKPACATACPTDSIKFGVLDDLRDEAQVRLMELEAQGIHDAKVWDPQHTSVRGTHSIFLIRGDERSYNLPPNPEAPTQYLKDGWRSVAIAASLMLLGTFAAFMGGGEDQPND